MAQWVGRIGVALQPLADRLIELLLERNVLHADETPVAQLDPGKGKTHRAYLWAYRSNVLQTGPPIVVFDYQIAVLGGMLKNSSRVGKAISWSMISLVMLRPKIGGVGRYTDRRFCRLSGIWHAHKFRVFGY